MYLERFTRQANNVFKKLLDMSVNAAQPQPQHSGHLVLALLDSPGIASHLLEKQGLRHSHSTRVRQIINQLLPAGQLTDRQIFVLAAELEDVLIMSGEYATYRHSSEIDTEHMLMGLYCYNVAVEDHALPLIDPDIDRIGAEVLRRFKINPWLIDQQIGKTTPPAKRLLSPY